MTSGAVSVNQRVIVKPSTPLEEGQHLVAVLPPPVSDEVAPDETVIVDVVLDDADFVVVNKEPGQVVHPGAGQREGTLVAGLLARYPQISLLSAEGLCGRRGPASCTGSTRVRRDCSSSRRLRGIRD